MLRRSILVVDSSASCSAPPPLFACRRFFAASATGARIDANRSSRHEPRTTRQTTHHTTKRGSTEEKTPIGLFFFSFSFDFFNILPLAIRVCVWLVCVLMYLSLLSFCQNEMVLLLSSCTNRGALFPTSVSHFFRFVSSRLCFQLDIERERMRRLAGVSFYFVSFVGVVSGGVARFPIFWSLAFCFLVFTGIACPHSYCHPVSPNRRRLSTRRLLAIIYSLAFLFPCDKERKWPTSQFSCEQTKKTNRTQQRNCTGNVSTNLITIVSITHTTHQTHYPFRLEVLLKLTQQERLIGTWIDQ